MPQQSTYNGCEVAARGHGDGEEAHSPPSLVVGEKVSNSGRAQGECDGKEPVEYSCHDQLSVRLGI